MTSIEIKMLDWEQIDLEELARFSFKVRCSEKFSFNPNGTIETEKRILEFRKRFQPAKVIIAEKNEEIVGWLSFDTQSEPIVTIGRWLPIIRHDKDYNLVFCRLINFCKLYCQSNFFTRLEISFSIEDDNDEDAYDFYKAFYEELGFPQIEMNAFLTRKLNDTQPGKVELPNNYFLQQINEVPSKDLYSLYYSAFEDGHIRMFLDQTEIERKSYFKDYYSLDKPYVNEASIVLIDKSNNELIGQTLVRPREQEAHLALLAIHPDYQGKRLGLTLLNYVMSECAKLGFQTMSLGVDIDNIPAFSLYMKADFNLQSRIGLHSWKAD
jgi:ribosomal protein S18 acetylase RimI-like enzyme